MSFKCVLKTKVFTQSEASYISIQSLNIIILRRIMNVCFFCCLCKV